ncbi:MAG: hypothetical protein KatS3mg120_1531 [Erythrobacter sp.]|nr:MAG: hypothetical protein KatS3mg120_1531 [Erythrobacter sp.]
MVSGKANSSSRGSRTGRRARAPLDEAALGDLALAYAARFATTAARLEAYLARKIAERGLAEGAKVDVPALVERLVALGYVDDAAFARMRARALVQRGYGARRIAAALHHAGVAAPLRAAHSPGEAAARRAAVVMAKKRRLGPWASSALGDGSPSDPRARARGARKSRCRDAARRPPSRSRALHPCRQRRGGGGRMAG